MPLKLCAEALGSLPAKSESNSQRAGTFNLIPKINILKKSALFTRVMGRRGVQWRFPLLQTCMEKINVGTPSPITVTQAWSRFSPSVGPAPVKNKQMSHRSAHSDEKSALMSSFDKITIFRGVDFVLKRISWNSKRSDLR